MKRILFALLGLCATACTYSVVVTHSEGAATDLVDTSQSAEPDIKPVISIPAAAL